MITELANSKQKFNEFFDIVTRTSEPHGAYFVGRRMITIYAYKPAELAFGCTKNFTILSEMRISSKLLHEFNELQLFAPGIRSQHLNDKHATDRIVNDSITGI